MTALSSNASGAPIGAHRFVGAPGFRDAIRSMLALLLIELRRSQGFWLLPLMVGLGLYLGNQAKVTGGIVLNNGNQAEVTGRIVLWPDLSVWTMQSYIIVGALAAGLAAWLVDRDRRQRVDGLVGTMATSPFRRDLVLLTTASFWGLAGYAIIAVWFGAQGLREATWGGPNVPLIATGALGIVILAGLGFIVGRIVRGKFSPIIAVAAAFFLSAAPEFIQTWMNSSSGMQMRLPFRPLTPWGLVGDSEPSVFDRFPSGYLIAGLIWLAAVTTITIVVIALMRSWRWSRTAWITLAVSGAVAVVGASWVMSYSDGRSFEEDRLVAFDWSCTTTGTIEVCVHPAYEAALDESAERLTEMLAPVAGLPGIPTRWEQNSPLRDETDGVGTFQPGQQFLFAYEMGNATFESTSGHFQFTAAQIVILEWLSSRADPAGQGGGFFDYPAELQMTPEVNDDGMTMGMSVDSEAEAFYAREIPAAAERFAALEPAEQRAWLEANWDALRTGELTLDDLP